MMIQKQLANFFQSEVAKTYLKTTKLHITDRRPQVFLEIHFYFILKNIKIHPLFWAVFG